MNTDFTAVPGWFSDENAGTGIAVADINGDGFPDVAILTIDDPPDQNSAYFRVGWGTDGQCTVGSWTEWTAVPGWNPWFNEGSGIALADISGNGRLDLVVFMIDGVADAANVGYHRIGWDLDSAGRVCSWSPWMTVPDWFSWVNADADIAVADVDGDGQLDLVILMVDAPDGPNQGYYRSGPLHADGTVSPGGPGASSRTGISGRTRAPLSPSPASARSGCRIWSRSPSTIHRARTMAGTGYWTS